MTYIEYEKDRQPVAGPISRPWLGWDDDYQRSQQRKVIVSEDESSWNRNGKGKEKTMEVDHLIDFDQSPTRVKQLPLDDLLLGKVRRQNQPPSIPSSGSTFASSSETSSTPTVGPSDQQSSSSSSTTSLETSPLFVGPSGSNSTTSSTNTFTQTSITSSSATSTLPNTRSSLPWSTRTKSPSSPTSTPFVPGVIMNLTLGGDSDTEAVYALPVEFGHGVDANSKRKRAPTYSGNGGEVQTVNLQIDLGSSDMWVASDRCRSADCRSAQVLFDDALSLASGVPANVTYQSGSVSGSIFWEEITMGSFQIGYQAFISATTVTNQDLLNGQFGGVLGLAFPAASTILTQIPGVTTSDPDGAIFLDNLFGAGLYAPTQRVFSLALARREDVRTTSLFSIGTISAQLCPSPCSPSYIPIIAQPQLGVTGYLHWRIPLQGISFTLWSDAQHGVGPTTKEISLGGSYVDKTRSTPLAVLDSGGVQILVASRTYSDVIYGAYGISMSNDGYYRMPCTQQISFIFTFAGKQYPVHPLDMTYPDPQDPSQTTCIGMIQYASNLGDTGDFILGSSFLKNVYSIFQYPDQIRPQTWQPTVGLVPLVNASVASQDFYAVRSLRQSLSSVSANQASQAGTPSYSPPSSPAASTASGGKVVSTAIIVASSIGGFFALAIAAFIAWWFCLRRRVGAGGGYGRRGRKKRKDQSLNSAMADRPETYRSDHSTSTLRSKKHEVVQRQKSMIEGYGYPYHDQDRDFEGESWASEGGDSIRLGYLPELLEEDEEGLGGVKGNRLSRSTVGTAAGLKAGEGSGSGGGSSLRESSVPPGPSNDEKEKEELVDLQESEKSTKDVDLIDLNALSPPKDRLSKPRSFSPSGIPNSTEGDEPRTNDRERNSQANVDQIERNSRKSGPYPQPNFANPTSPFPPTTQSNPSTQKPRSKSSTRNQSQSQVMSMAGPFPTPSRSSFAYPTSNANSNSHTSNGRRESSPRYEHDIRSSDYFMVPLVSEPVSMNQSGGHDPFGGDAGVRGRERDRER